MKLFGLLQKESGSKKKGPSVFSFQEVSQVLQFFPIGQRLQYFCEYHKSIKIDTIIVAYAVNDHVVYSSNDIRIETKEGNTYFLVSVDGVEVKIDSVHSFNILVPLITRTEVDFRKGGKGKTEEEAKERTINDFKRLNTITLFVRNPGVKGIPHLDTTVKRVIALQHGIYAKQNLVVLQPDLESFECVDYRRFKRIDTNIPGRVQKSKDKTWHDCQIIDFSDKFVRLALEVKKYRMESFVMGIDIVLDVDPDASDKSLVVHGSIHRKRKNYIVISYKSIMKSGRFQPVDVLDELYIKSTLLGHPETDRGQK